MQNLTIRFFAVIGALFLLTLPVQAARLALVIGNDGYRQIEPLINARNDARLMAATLKEAGFEVERVHENLDRKDMLRAINGFKARITKADEVVFFYAGHGIQIGRQSPVLLPVDITQENDDQIVQDGVQLSTVQDALTGAGFALLVIDACRDNPFPRKSDGTRGLARQTGLDGALAHPPEGSMLLMSAGTGEKALDYVPDGTRANGLFTHEFVQAIRSPGKQLILAIAEAKARVTTKAHRVGNRQRPALLDESSSSGFVFFAAPALVPVVAHVPVGPTVQLTSEQEVEQKLWNVIESSNDVQDFQDYLKRYPNGRFAPLAQRQVRVLTTRQQVLPQVQTPVAVVVPPQPTPVQTSVAAPGNAVRGKRVALLIGNANYQQMPLKFSVNDVQLIGSEMQSLGFSTQVVTNADRKTMVSAIENFGRQAVDAEVTMIYYAGHGAQLGGENYLIPVGFNFQREDDLKYQAVQLDQVMESFKGVQKQGILVVDASHSPFGGLTRSTSRGLAQIESPAKTLVVFSTAPGRTSEESGTGTHSPFARHLAFYLKQPGLAVIDIYRKTSEAVEKETRGRQVPSLIGAASLGIYLATPSR